MRGVGDVQLETRVGRRDEEIVRATEELGVDLIALGWTQELGPDRASVVRAALERAHVPVLLVPVRPDSKYSGREGGSMEKLAIVARLKPGAGAQAAELIEKGPPFDPGEDGRVDRHVVYLSAGEVVFVFEGREVEWVVEELVDLPMHWLAADALQAWRPLVEGEPRIARPAYAWAHGPVLSGG